MLYEYKCTECNTVTEIYTTDKELTTIECPKCFSVAKRIISSVKCNATRMKYDREHERYAESATPGKDSGEI